MKYTIYGILLGIASVPLLLVIGIFVLICKLFCVERRFK